MNTVIPVDQSIQNDFADSQHRIFRTVHSISLFIDDRCGPDISADKGQRLLQHL